MLATGAALAQPKAIDAAKDPVAALKDVAKPNDNTASKESGKDADAGKEPGTKDDEPKKLTTDIVDKIEKMQFNRLLEQNAPMNWIVLGIALLSGVVLGRVLAFILHRFASRLRDRNWPIAGHLLSDFASPLSLALLTTGIWVGLVQIRMAEPLRQFTDDILLLLISVAVVWLVFNFVGVVDVILTRRKQNGRSSVDRTAVDLIRKTGRLFVLIVAVLFIAENVLGANITSWLAGLGIIGLAVSLAAQDSLKNVFGSLTIYLDKPFGIGDLVEYTGVMGVVEHIGFRATTIRSLEGPVLNVPNAKIVSDPVKNVSARNFIRRKLEIALVYETTAEQIQQAMDILRELTESEDLREAIQHEESDEQPAPPRIYFDELASDHLRLVVYYWHKPGDWWQYKDHASRLNLQILMRFKDAGLRFAFPTQTVHLAGSTPPRQREGEVQDDKHANNSESKRNEPAASSKTDEVKGPPEHEAEDHVEEGESDDGGDDGR